LTRGHPVSRIGGCGKRGSVAQGDEAGFDAAMAQYGGQIAAVIIDLMPTVPVSSPPTRLRRACPRPDARRGVLLIVDEVITFRLGRPGLHSQYGIDPDLVPRQDHRRRISDWSIGGRQDIMACSIRAGA